MINGILIFLKAYLDTMYFYSGFQSIVKKSLWILINGLLLLAGILIISMLLWSLISIRKASEKFTQKNPIIINLSLLMTVLIFTAVGSFYALQITLAVHYKHEYDSDYSEYYMILYNRAWSVLMIISCPTLTLCYWLVLYTLNLFHCNQASTNKARCSSQYEPRYDSVASTRQMDTSVNLDL